MLELKNISKIYELGKKKDKDYQQVEALNNVSIKFREHEFVSILGPSGCGKTTLLNIVGGLDKYSSGDLIINGKSTKEFKDRDWDVYRNHSVGFVFQSYNLIPHQTVLQNVELALTLSGISRDERRVRAKEALTRVGLEDKINAKPNQLSGGQMQRVAIARALVNNPEVILADEPTGALDSKTSVQIIDLLKEISKEKLVVMVTHNPELAETYSTRIIRLKDGELVDDTNPVPEDEIIPVRENNMKRKSMSFFSALNLSFKNLLTKKARTILVSFAGSIGIIGIAVILSISTGVQNYIDKTEEETLSSYPITIEETTFDIGSFMANGSSRKTTCNEGEICSNNIMGDLLSATTSSQISNNLEEFKTYLDNNDEIKNLVNDIKYHYGFDLQIYKNDTNLVKVNPNMLASALMGGNNSSDMAMNMMYSNQNVFTELMDNDRLLESQYDIVKGRFPKKYNELVLIVDENNQLTDYTMYALGLKDQKDILELQQNIMNNIPYENVVTSYSYNEILGMKYKLVLNTDYYVKENGLWIDKRNDLGFLKNIVDNGLELEIVGILKPSEDAQTSLSDVIGYTSDLVKYVMNENNNSNIAKEQKSNVNTNVFTNTSFDGLMSSYDTNLRLLGVTETSKPTSIDIYPKSFEDKETIKEIINDYNQDKKDNGNEDDVITYTDYVGVLMSGITGIIDVITIVLIGFVAVSLVVSSIMIAIITYISVLERTKEIGILRAIGASKKDISRVFNAETFIEGLIAGVLGILVTLLINLPINLIVGSLSGVSTIATLEPMSAIILVLISITLTVIAGFIPAKMASKKDPVESLRTE